MTTPTLMTTPALLIVVPEPVRAATERRLRAVGRGGPLATWFGDRGDRVD